MKSLMNAIISICLVYPVILVSFSGAQDPCRDYINIGSARRNVEYQHLNRDNPICDFHVTEDQTAWYRFKFFEGEKLPEKCVSRNFCGTENPIWMKGSHPLVVGETVVRTACANVGPPGDCCGWSETMSVRKCRDGLSEYFVYQLPRPRDCPMSYCTEGGPAPCPPGHTWDPSKGECIEGTTSTRATTLTATTSTTTTAPTTSTSRSSTVRSTVSQPVPTDKPLPETTTKSTIQATTTLSMPSTTTSAARSTTSQPIPSGDPNPNNHRMPVGLIVGLCFATAIGGGLVALALFLVISKRNGQKKTTKTPEEPPPYSAEMLGAENPTYGFGQETIAAPLDSKEPLDILHQ